MAEIRLEKVSGGSSVINIRRFQNSLYFYNQQRGYRTADDINATDQILVQFYRFSQYRFPGSSDRTEPGRQQILCV